MLLPIIVWAQTPQKPKEKDTTIVLNAVSVSGKKPMLKRKADRLEFNIENTPLQNLNGWDILKIPQM